jgi:hypothetical protein
VGVERCPIEPQQRYRNWWKDPRPIEISTAGYLRTPHKDIQVRRVVDLQSRDLRWFDGMRITNPTRTVIDLAGILDRKRLDLAIDEARRRRLLAERAVRETLERLGRQGRPEPD